MELIRYIDRQTLQECQENVPGYGMLKWLYTNPLGKLTLHGVMKRKFVSVLGGWYMNSGLSRNQIAKFITEHDLDMSIYQLPEYGQFRTFNEFFYRKIKPEFRPVQEGCVSPADGKVLAFQSLNDIGKFFIKGTHFTTESFLLNENLAAKYTDGSMLIVRLAPNDYHRFHFPADGKISQTTAIQGSYFSVSPLALLQSLEIFTQNHRVYSSLSTSDYGDILIAEVGATLVGSVIQTYSPQSEVKKGDEKGYFAFGGSTVVLLFEKGSVQFDQDLLENTTRGYETMVQMGEQIGS